MAVWQIDCNIVPKRDDISSLSIEEIISWKNFETPSHEIKFLNKDKSWSSNIVQYGKSNETCIEFIYIEGNLEEISCRLDLRNLTKRDLTHLIEYVGEINAMFLVDDKTYPPDINIMIDVMKNSKANEICKSPGNYIKNNQDMFMKLTDK